MSEVGNVAREIQRLRYVSGRAPTLMYGGFLLTLIAALCIVGPLLLDPLAQDPAVALAPPSVSHPFGTDEVGRDILARVAAGGRQSIVLAVISVAVGITGGALVGGLGPMVGGPADRAAVLVIDSLFSFPPILIALVVVAAVGNGTLASGIAVGMGWIPYFARFIRGQVLITRERAFVKAALANGVRLPAVMVRHVLPQSLGPIVVVAAFALSGSVVMVAGLGFLGLGTQPPDAEWGTMLSTGRSYWSVAPWMVIFPGIALVVASLGANLVGDGLQELYDPHGLAARERPL